MATDPAFFTIPVTISEAGVTLANIAPIQSGTALARVTAGAGAPEEVTFTDLKTALGIETLDAATIKTRYESNANTNPFTDSEQSKLAGLESSKYLGTYPNLSALQTAHPNAEQGNYADVDGGVGAEVARYVWDDDDADWTQLAGASAAETPASIKTLYESNADTNAYDDAAVAKVAASLVAGDLDTLSKINATLTDATLIDTGDSRLSDSRAPTAHTHTASEVTDFAAAVATEIASDPTVASKAPISVGVGHAAHGADANFVRPAGYPLVMWFGTVTPNNMAVGDLYFDTTGS